MTAASPPAVTVDIALADALTRLVARAGAAIMALAPDQLAIRAKADRSPVTAADEAADAVIAAGLCEILPGLPVVSEERVAVAAPPADGNFVLVDPLDGTKEFLDGRDEFTVNLAIISNRYPVAGFIAVPALGLVYRGVLDHGAERIALDRGDGGSPHGRPTAIRTRKAPAAGLLAAVSRSHLDAASDALIARLPVSGRQVAGSAVKFCRIAEGLADVYPRLGRTCEWDIAAGHALVVAAGGVMTSASGEPLTYGHAEADYAVEDFIAWGDPDAARAAPRLPVPR